MMENAPTGLILRMVSIDPRKAHERGEHRAIAPAAARIWRVHVSASAEAWASMLFDGFHTRALRDFPCGYRAYRGRSVAEGHLDVRR